MIGRRDKEHADSNTMYVIEQTDFGFQILDNIMLTQILNTINLNLNYKFNDPKILKSFPTWAFLTIKQF
jgi:hypothetical protein